MIAVVDYGMGNLRSVAKAFEAIGEEVKVTHSASDLAAAARIVLPGVGAFNQGIKNLRATGLIDALETEARGKGKPFLGICLGMQLLADEGLEHGRQRGLGWIPGVVERLAPSDASLRLPHVGWNDVAVEGGCPLFEGLGEKPDFYFTHSYRFRTDRHVVGTCDYGGPFAAAVLQDNVFAVQFHPEKSQDAGLRLLKNFAAWSPMAAHA